MSIVHFVNAPAAAGKTRAMARNAHSLAILGEAALIVVPTIVLIKQIQDDIHSIIPPVNLRAVHGEFTDRVIGVVLAELKLGALHGRILIITWSSFERLPFFPSKTNWNVFVDEIPQPCMVLETNAPDTHSYLTDHLELKALGPAYSRILVSKSYALKKLAATSDAALLKDLSPMARQVLSPNLQVYVKTASFQKLLHGKGKKLTIFCVLRSRMFDGFNKVTVLGANFKHSLLYLIWKQRGVNFVEDAKLTDELRFKEHNNGSLVAVYYAANENWSKRFRDRNDGKALKMIAAAAAELMNGQQFAWSANKDVSVKLFEGYSAVQLPQISHGLNCFAHINNVVYLSARLPPPQHFTFLEWLGVSSEQVRRAVHYEALYQTVNRSSVRDLSNNNPKRIVVPDHASAKYLHLLFPGSTVEKLDVSLGEADIAKPRGRRRMFDDVSSRVRAYRAGKKEETARLASLMMGEPAGFTALVEKVVQPQFDSGERKTCNENTIGKEGRNSVTGRMRGSVFDHMKATHPIAVVPEMSDDAFVAALKISHTERHVSKEENRLICPAIFDADLAEPTSRGLANVVYANGIWLDVDVGDMTHKELAVILPQLRIVAFNSFSSTKSEPRYRVYIPASRTMSAGEYGSIISQIIQIVKDSGYPLAKRSPKLLALKAHGIDMSKRHAASLFYLPCQARDPKGKIWKDFKDDCRRPLDVDNWLEHAIPVETVESAADPAPSRSDSREAAEPHVDQARVDRALERWATLGTQAGIGDSEMFFLSQELKRANVRFHEAEAMLLQAAQGANSPKDRRSQAMEIIKRSRKSWPVW